MGYRMVWLDGSVTKMTLLQSDYPIKDEASCRSNAQYRFGQRLLRFFGSEVILEEFGIPHSGLSLDFFMPRFNVAFEIQGRQHYNFVPFMHGDRLSFGKQKERDSNKAAWCHINEIRLICVRDCDVDKVDIIKKMDAA